MDLTSSPPRVLLTFQTNTSGPIKSLVMTQDKQHLFIAGFADGLLAKYRLRGFTDSLKPLLESEIRGSPEPRCILFLEKLNQLLVGHKSGVIYLYQVGSEFRPLCNLISLK